jgi:hypothetical protein
MPIGKSSLSVNFETPHSSAGTPLNLNKIEHSAFPTSTYEAAA